LTILRTKDASLLAPSDDKRLSYLLRDGIGSLQMRGYEGKELKLGQMLAGFAP
jgi:hypothetical protein